MDSLRFFADPKVFIAVIILNKNQPFRSAAIVIEEWFFVTSQSYFPPSEIEISNHCETWTEITDHGHIAVGASSVYCCPPLPEARHVKGSNVSSFCQ